MDKAHTPATPAEFDENLDDLEKQASKTDLEDFANQVKCSFELKSCGYKQVGGCKKPFSPDQRATDAKHFMPSSLCHKCKGDFLKAKKKVSCVFMSVTITAIILVACLIFAILISINQAAADE